MVTILGRDFETYDFDKIQGTCFGFVYVTKNNKSGKYYVGMHYTWNRNYLGSGTILKNAIKRDGKSSFTRYIIDTANSYEELVDLELHYITTAFGTDVSMSPMFYNLNNLSHKNGSNSWSYLTDEERATRVAKANKSRRATVSNRTAEERKALSDKLSAVAKQNYMDDPNLKQLVSEKTREAMTVEVRNRISESKLGVKPNFSDEHRKKLSDVGKTIGAENLERHRRAHGVWNKGHRLTDEHRAKLSNSKRVYYAVHLNDELILSDVGNVGGYQGIADTISTYFSGKKVGRNNVVTLIKTGEPYEAKVPSKQFMNGLRIIKKGTD